MVLIVLLLCWGAFVLVWGLGWIYNLLKGPKAQKRKPYLNLISIVGMLALFLLSRFVRFSSFALSLPLWLQITGGVLLVLSTGLTLWSRFVLGKMWSSVPETKLGHELRTDGPYQISRHPIYTGLSGMMAGSVLLSSANLFWGIGVLVMILMLCTRIPVEEKLMIETFGEQYLAYQQQVPQLIPGMKWLEKGLSGAKKE